MRFLFCFIPALIGSGMFWLIHPAIAVTGLVLGFCFGWIITTPRPERGERL